jgi:hypothetical protein
MCHEMSGSAASLPQIPEANPHLTITAFSFMLCDNLIKKYCTSSLQNQIYKLPQELIIAKDELLRNSNQITSKSTGEEYPNLYDHAIRYNRGWLSSHNQKDE